MRSERVGNGASIADASSHAAAHPKQARAAQLTLTGPGRRIYAVGDVHGHIDLLRRLVDEIACDLRRSPAKQPLLLFLGDLVDRGPNSRACVQAAMGLPLIDGVEQAALLGNHEHLFSGGLRGRQIKLLLPWLTYGGGATLASYGVDDVVIEGLAGDPALWIAEATAAVPENHFDWIDGLPRMMRFGDYLFAHAGVHPERALHDQDPNDLIWIREPFLSNPEPVAGCVVVHGHTPNRVVTLDGPRIGVDTGAAYGGPLTALVLDDDERRLLQVHP